MSSADSHEIWLPFLFWRDHDERALPSGEFIKLSYNMVRVRVTRKELAEIRSDAEFYAQGNVDMDDGGSMCRSAAATVRAIDKVAPLFA
jgi:hypothetical protein